MDEELKPKQTKPIINMSVGICSGAFVYAYYSVCLSELANLLFAQNRLSSSEFVYQLSVATSLFNLGAFISPIAYKRFTNYFGELKGLLLIDILAILSILFQLIKLEFHYLAIGRFVLGLLMGISTGIIPVYLNSLSPKSISGQIGSYNQLSIVVGIMASYLMGYIINDEKHDDEIRWRIYLAIPILPLVGRIVILQFFYPFNSIEYSLRQNDIPNIKQYCQAVYGNSSQKTVKAIIANRVVSHEKTSLHKGTWRKRFILAIVVISSNQLSGINGIFFYAKQLFTKVTHEQLALAQTLMFVLSVAQVISAFVSSRVIDLYGRKKMILNGQKLLIIVLMGIFVSDRIIQLFSSKLAEVLIVLLLFVHILVFNMTLGPVCIIYCAEIVEDITYIIITLKLLSLTMAVSSEYMIEYLGIGKMFLLFAVLTSLAHLFMEERMKETEKLRTEEIYNLFNGKEKEEEEKLSLMGSK